MPEVLNLLCASSGGKKGGGSGARKCVVRLLDTVFMPADTPSGAPEWYFTTKSGAVSRKKEDKASLSGVFDRFSKFALANPNNKERTVGVFVHGNGYRQLLSESSLNEIIDQQSSVLMQAGSHLQVFLRPCQGKQEMVCVKISSGSSSEGKRNSYAFDYCTSSNMGKTKAPLVNEKVIEQIRKYSAEMLSHLRETRELAASEMEIEFVMDDNEHVWLSNIPTCSVYEADENSTPYLFDGDGDGYHGEENHINGADSDGVAGRSPLPSVKNASGNSAPLNGQSLLQSAFYHGDDAGVGGGGGTSGGDSGDVLVGNGGLVRKEGDVYSCAMGPDDLPGLRAWTLVSLSDGDNLQWSIDMTECDAAANQQANPAMEPVKRQRAEQRHKTSPFLVALMAIGEELLLGFHNSVNNKEESAFKSAWKHVYKQAVEQCAGLDEVMVCGNTHAVCRKLESLCNIDFEPMIKLSVSPKKDRPRSEESNPRGLRSAEEASRLRILSAGGGDMSEDVDDKANGDDLPPEAIENSFFSTEMQAIPLNKLPKGSKMKGTVAKKKKGKGVGVQGGGSGGGGAGSTSTFRRDGGMDMNKAPNIEMIAKFAAEKEKHQRDIRAKKDEERRQQAMLAVESNDPLYDEEVDSVGQEWPERFAKPAKKKAGKKKSLSKQGPPVFRNDEERLAHFEQMAAQPQQQPQMMGMPYNPTASLGSFGSMVSGSEADFMVRQAQNGDVESTLGGVQVGERGFGGSVGGDSIASAGSLAVVGQVDGALKERVVSLTKQLESAVSANHRKDSEIEVLSEKLRKSLSDLDTTRRQAESDLQHQEDDFEFKVLELKESHAKHMSSMASASGNPAAGAAGGLDQSHNALTTGGTGNGPSTDPNSVSFQGNKQLMDQLESLRKENRRISQEFADERQRLQSDGTAKLLAQERALKSEVSQLRGRVTLLEDEGHQLSDENSHLKARTDGLQAVSKQLESARDDAIENQNRLRADLKNMQQSVNASYRLESAQELTVGADADTQIRLNEAKFEARTRQLINKVEFLKAQLAAEQASSEEMRSTIASNQAKLDEMRSEFRNRLQEADKEKQAAVDDAERQVESQYESRMNELTTLQTKMKMMQGQLQDAFSDSTLLKQREEAAKSAAAKATSTQSILRAEIDQLRAQLVEAREEKDNLMMQTGSKQTNDATIRRLDNERQYLKSQLASEITHKNEMQNALAKNQHQLNEVNKQWKADVASLMEKSQQENQDFIAREQALQQKNITLDANVRRLEGSNAELKDGFSKMRDQVRMEQLSLENATSVNRRLQEQYEITKSELNRMRESEEQTADEHLKQMEALQATMAENDERRSTEIVKLKDELSHQYKENSQVQKMTMDLKAGFRSERLQGTKSQAAMNIVTSLRKWRLNRAAVALRMWSTNSTLIGVAAQFRGHVNDLVEKTLAEQREIKETALQSLREEMQAVQEQRVQEMNAEFDRQADDIFSKSESEKQRAIDEAHDEMKAHVESVEKEWGDRVDRALADGKNELARVEDEHQVKMNEFSARCTADLNRALEEADRRVDGANTKTEMSDQMVTRLKAQLSEFEQMHNDALVKLVAEHTTKTKAAEKQVKADNLELREALGKEKEQALVEAGEHLQAKLAELREGMTDERNDAEERLKSGLEDAFEAEKQGLYHEHENRVRELREDWEEEQKSSLEKRDADNKDLLDTKMEQYAKSVEAERVRAVKLESSKWRQALKDAEHRFELEVSKAKAEGRSEMKGDMKEDMNALENSRKISLQRMQSQMEEKLKALQHEHDEASTKELARQERLREEAMMDRERSTREMLEAEHSDEMKLKIEEAWKDSGEMWQKRLSKEELRLTDFKKDVAAQSQQLAKERNDLQERVNQSDEIIKRMEALNRAEVNRIEKDREAEREMQELKFQKAKKHAIRDLEREQNDALESVENKYKEIAERRIVVERGKLEEDMNKQIHQLQTESEGLITGLEAAVAELKSEKDALSKDLQETSTKLEDTEDALYDLQQQTKKKQKDNSVTFWRQIISQQKMKSKYESHMDDMEKDFEEREKILTVDMMNEQNEMILASMKLSALLADIEDQRKRAHRILTQFRTEELLEKRTLIRVLEKDFERLTMEKDSLEEQRDLMEEEIEDLESQVRGLEDEIREHNRTSSMQNGRINVAHARKKRRLDGELERMLETIEQRRINMGEMDERAADKARERDQKESEMVDLEKQVVGILVEQQRKVLKAVEDMRGTAEDKCRLVMSVARLPWPAPDAPSIEDVKQLQKQRQLGKKKAAEENEDDDDE